MSAHERKSPGAVNMPQMKGTFYVTGGWKCADCGYECKIRFGLDKYIYHECNKGNVETPVPNLLNIKENV